MLWVILILMLMALTAGGILYISFQSAEFGFVKRISRGRRWMARFLCMAFYIGVLALLWLLWNMMNALICLIHLVLFWILCDLVQWTISIIRQRKPKRYLTGGVAILLCILYLAGGWFADHHVWQKNYTLETKKRVDSIRVVQITDSHIGATFHADGFAAYMEKINALSPDVVVVTGDFVDDDTSREDMLGGCDALGKLKTRYGVFFVYGNHDKGYSREASKGWTNQEMRERLEENEVVILEDEAQLIDDRFYIVGRKDRSEEQRSRGRASAEDLLAKLDHEHYIIMLDHQPHDFDAEAEAGADLVLCGHTHGGQFIPIRYVGEWIGENNLRYGYEKRLETEFIVSSGISNWALKFKTGCHSEYVVIDIQGTK